MRSLFYASLLTTLIAASVPAGAVTFVGSVPGAPDPGAVGDLVIDFENGSTLPSGIALAAGSQYSILQGLAPRSGYNPAGDLTHYLSVPGTGTSGTAVIDFTQYQGSPLGDFSFYWGSIDRDNHLTVTTSTGSLDVFGSDLIAAGFGSATSARGNRRAYFSLQPGELLTSITLASPTAFEIDDVVFRRAATVPEPGTWLMFISGMGLVGGTVRRRRERVAFG